MIKESYCRRRRRLTIFESHNSKNITDFSLWYIEVLRDIKLLSFLATFLKSYTKIVKTLSEHMIMVILNFWVKNVVFE